MNPDRNNLDKALSPYLQQHQDNPVHWQEWSEEVILHAQKTNKPLFVSIGYATCHWCHVLAAEAFSDPQTANFLNQHFVCIKVDREQRPDIDAYAMAFLQEIAGHGGWPLNIFLTPQLQPFYAFTYLPIQRKGSMPGFLETIQGVSGFYNQNQAKIETYTPHSHDDQSDLRDQPFIDELLHHFNPSTSSFSPGPQFPPHCTLLFLLHYYEQTKQPEIKKVIISLLEKMAVSGLHDHLQGGFFRYCVDESWTIPHFEKMLYDQAMSLWVYSVAYKIFGKKEYKLITEKILLCLEQTFTNGDLYYSGLDADTNHEEGTTYLWTREEIAKILDQSEHQQFLQIYDLVDGHLIKKKNMALPQIEAQLLSVRKRRAQPSTDTKVITSWNALLGIALITCYRMTGNTLAKTKARLLFDKLRAKHYTGAALYHSSNHGQHQTGNFLEDYAAFLLLTTYLAEEDAQLVGLVKELSEKVLLFYDAKTKQWVEHKNLDFHQIPAQTYDHPLPSSRSLVELALAHAAYFTDFANKTTLSPTLHLQYKSALAHDFWNLAAFFSLGGCHIVSTPHVVSWNQLPAFSMQIPAKKVQYCYNQQCQQFANVLDMLEEMKKNQMRVYKGS